MSDEISPVRPADVGLPDDNSTVGGGGEGGEEGGEGGGEGGEGDGGAPSDGLPTPRATHHNAASDDASDDASDASDPSADELAVNENYFRPPPTSPHPPVRRTPSQLLSLRSSIRPGTSGGVSPSGLQSKATIAISLPEGVYAQQQDGVGNPGGGGGGGGVTTAPSFSDSTSVKSFAPTISTGDNDVESMLGEILEESEASFGGAFVEELVDDDDEDEDEETAGEDEEDLPEEEMLARWHARRKHFFILSAAGKPIYSRYGNETIISSYIGVIQAIISFFADSSDTLQTFESGTHRFVVVASGPIYLVAISCIGETPAQLRSQLDALYIQVLSTLTLSQLNKVFFQRYNFDLRRLLGGTEVFLDGLVDSMTRGSPQVLLSALECVKIRKSHRERINDILLKHRSANLLYGLIVADQRLVSVIRPKRHSLHPPDLQLLFSMLFNAATFRDGGEHWTPICMPKFNSKGFLHAYIHFFEPEVCVVLISADKGAFFEMRDMASSVVSALGSSALLPHVMSAVARYTPTDIIPGTPIRHFLYKSRQNVQFTMPAWGSQYVTQASRRRVMTLYHRLHAKVHAKNAHLKVYFCSRNHGEEALAWILPGFELYLVAGPGAKRDAMARGAQRVVAWVRGEEERLFVIGGATF